MCRAAKIEDRRVTDRTLVDLLHHLENEPLVKSAFNPGTRPNGEPRTTPADGENTRDLKEARVLLEDRTIPDSGPDHFR
jgi:hypothetical protein